MYNIYLEPLEWRQELSQLDLTGYIRFHVKKIHFRNRFKPDRNFWREDGLADGGVFVEENFESELALVQVCKVAEVKGTFEGIFYNVKHDPCLGCWFKLKVMKK